MKKFIAIIGFIIASTATICAQEIVERKQMNGSFTFTKPCSVLKCPVFGFTDFEGVKEGCKIVVECQDFDSAGKLIKVKFITPDGEALTLGQYDSKTLEIVRAKKDDGRFSYIIYDDNFRYAVLVDMTGVEGLNGYMVEVDTIEQ